MTDAQIDVGMISSCAPGRAGPADHWKYPDDNHPAFFILMVLAVSGSDCNVASACLRLLAWVVLDGDIAHVTKYAVTQIDLV